MPAYTGNRQKLIQLHVALLNFYHDARDWDNKELLVEYFRRVGTWGEELLLGKRKLHFAELAAKPNSTRTEKIETFFDSTITSTRVVVSSNISCNR